MKKILINLLAISSVAVTLVACSSGSSSSSTSPAAAPVVNPVTPPASGIPVSENGDTPTYYNAQGGIFSISTPQAVAGGVQYVSVTLQGSAAAALIQELATARILSNNSFNGSQTFNSESVSYVVNLSTGVVNVAPVNNVTTPVFSISQQTDVTAVNAVFYGTNTPQPSLVLSPFLVGTQAALNSTNPALTTTNTVPLSGCVANPGTPQALDASVVANNWYVGVGTSSGNVCIYNVNNTGSQLTSPWSNLTPQGVNHGYTPSPISNFTFTNLGTGSSPLVGYWQNTNGQIWRVTAAIGSTIYPTSFWQVNSPSTQTSTAEVNKGQSVTFTNVVPTARVNSIYSDPTNNLYVGTTDGYVYKLAAGSTNWSAPAQVGSSTSPVYVSTNGLGTGAIATSTLAGGIVTVSVQ